MSTNKQSVAVRRLAAASVSSVILTLVACTPYVAHWGTATHAPRLSGGIFWTEDDVRLPVKAWLPAQRPRAILIAVHGFDDYSQAFAYMAPYLIKQGIAVYAYDQRGFGDTPNRGLWPGTDKLVQDLRQFTAVIKRSHPNTPLYWLGHSMGAAVVILAAAGRDERPVDGLILAAPAVWGDDTFNTFYRAALWTGAHTLPWLDVSSRHLDIQVSDNIEVLRKLSKDPLMIHEARLDTLYGLVGLMDRALTASDRLRLPALVLYGLKDQVIPRASVCRMVARMRDEPTVVLYAQGYHLLLRDLHAERVWKDIAAWTLGEPLAPDNAAITSMCG